MSNRIMLIPVGSSVGLTSISLGLVRALEQKNVDVGFFKPISQPKPGESGPEKSTEIIKQTSNINPPEPIALSHAEKRYSEGEQDVLLEEIVGCFETYAKQNQTIIIEGLVQTQEQNYTVRLNRMVANALGASVVFVATINDQEKSIEEMLDIAANHYGGVDSDNVLGCIFNKVGAPLDPYDIASTDSEDEFCLENQTKLLNKIQRLPILKRPSFKLLGAIPWDFDLIAPRVQD